MFQLRGWFVAVTASMFTANPNVIFVESFDEPSLGHMKRRWESVSNAEIMSLSDDTPPESRGRSLLMTHVGGKGSGGHLYRRLLPGYDRLYTRFYVKFDPQSAPIHHFFQVEGYNPSSSYPHGGAGERPRGGGRFSSGVEPSAALGFGITTPTGWTCAAARRGVKLGATASSMTRA